MSDITREWVDNCEGDDGYVLIDANDARDLIEQNAALTASSDAALREVERLTVQLDASHRQFIKGSRCALRYKRAARRFLRQRDTALREVERLAAQIERYEHLNLCVVNYTLTKPGRLRDEYYRAMVIASSLISEENVRTRWGKVAAAPPPGTPAQ